MQTAEEAAWQENFIKDLEKITKEIMIILNKQLPIDKQFELVTPLWKNFCTIGLNDNSFAFYLSPNEPNNKKIKWDIKIYEKHEGDSGPIEFVPVSHNGVYTKKELERAKNSCIVKILDYMKRKLK